MNKVYYLQIVFIHKSRIVPIVFVFLAFFFLLMLIFCNKLVSENITNKNPLLKNIFSRVQRTSADNRTIEKYEIIFAAHLNLFTKMFPW